MTTQRLFAEKAVRAHATRIKAGDLSPRHSSVYRVWTDELAPAMRAEWPAKYGPWPDWNDRSVEDIVEDFELNDRLGGADDHDDLIQNRPLRMKSGTLSRLAGDYTAASRADLPGKTIEAVGFTYDDADGEYDPHTWLFFADETCFGFEHPANVEY